MCLVKNLTKRLSNSELVTLAVFLIGGNDRYVDTEDVAMKTHELAPGRFSWRKYTDQINLELVRVRLSEAKSAAHGAMLRGSGTRGWILTAAGFNLASKLAQDSSTLEPTEMKPRERGGSVDAQRSDRAKVRIRSSYAWSKWPGNKDEITVNEAEEVFRIDSYTSAEQRLEKVDRMRKSIIGDPSLLEFLQHLESLVNPISSRR